MKPLTQPISRDASTTWSDVILPL